MTRQRLLDTGIPLLLAAAAIAEALTTDGIDAPWPAVVWIALGTTVPLIWRRSAPLVVLAVALVTVGVTDVRWELAGELFAGVLLRALADVADAFEAEREGRSLHAPGHRPERGDL